MLKLKKVFKNQCLNVFATTKKVKSSKNKSASKPGTVLTTARPPKSTSDGSSAAGSSSISSSCEDDEDNEEDCEVAIKRIGKTSGSISSGKARCAFDYEMEYVLTVLNDSLSQLDRVSRRCPQLGRSLPVNKLTFKRPMNINEEKLLLLNANVNTNSGSTLISTSSATDSSSSILDSRNSLVVASLPVTSSKYVREIKIFILLIFLFKIFVVFIINLKKKN